MYRGDEHGPNGDSIARVVQLEAELQTPECRCDPARVADLLAPDFTEIGASGRRYTRAQIIELLAAETDADPPIGMAELAVREVGPGFVLVQWTSVHAHQRARRSSLWRHDDKGWRLVHHQGTPLGAPKTA